MLDNKGKIITDVFVSKNLTFKEGELIGKPEELCLEIPKSITEDIKRHLKKFGFKKDFQIFEGTDAIDTLVIMVYS